MKFKDYLIDIAKWLLRLLIVAVLLFGPLILAVMFMNLNWLLFYINSAAIMTVFLINYFKKR